MKKFLILCVALMVNCIMGVTFAGAVGAAPYAGALVMNGLAFAAGFMPAMEGSLREGVFTEVWTGELVKKLRGRLEGSWLDGIPDNSALVNNDVIHLVDVGVDPDVLINNTTYPIDIQVLEDADISISLDKFQTKATPVTDDELYAISYDKMARVRDSHNNSISDGKFSKAAHSFCAQHHTATTPVLKTSGKVDPATGRKRLTRDDLVALKASLDRMGVPADGRRLVLCSDHANDMLLFDENFARQYSLDNANGRIARIYGFDVYEYGNNPYYTVDGEKKSLFATPDTGEFQCSFAFYTGRVFKATGSTKMYYSEAKTDPLTQRNLINFRHYFIAMPKKSDAGAVLMSAYSSSEAPVISGAELIDDFAATAGSKYRTYATSNGEPVTAQSNADWITATVGSDGHKVTFAVTAYAHAESGDNPRVGTVTLAIAGTSATKTVTIKQAMAEA